MNGYLKRDKVDETKLVSSSSLPENAIKWATLFRKDDPEFSFRFVNT